MKSLEFMNQISHHKGDNTYQKMIGKFFERIQNIPIQKIFGTSIIINPFLPYGVDDTFHLDTIALSKQ